VVNKVHELACLTSEKKPDLILITESWCNPNVNDAYLALPGYHLQPDLRADRLDTANGIGGGLLVYSRDRLTILPCDKVNNFNQYVTFKVNIGTVTTTFYLVYRPPSSTDMTGLIEIIEKAGPNSILVGDFNLPGIDWRQGTAVGRARDFLEATESKFMEQLIDFPTQVIGNTLDLVLTNACKLIDNIQAEGRLGKSDHEMISIKLTGGKPAAAADLQKPNWNLADWDNMKRDLSSTDWYNALEGLNTEAAWNKIKTTINSLISRYVPVRKVRPPNRPIWMTNEISRAMDQKRRLWRRRAPAEEYKEAEKKVRNLVRNAKRNFERKLAKNHGNSKPFYSYLKKSTHSPNPA